MADAALLPYDVEHVSSFPAPATYRPHTFVDLTLELRYSAPKFKELETPFCCALWHRCISEGFSEKSTISLIRGHPKST